MPTLNPGKYASVMAEYAYAPTLIESAREYRRCKRALERLLFPERKRSVEEDAMARLLSHLIEIYEDGAAVPPKTTPRQVLQHLMEQRGLKQADLVGVFGTPSIISELFRGNREVNATQARHVCDFFDLPAHF